MVDPDHDLDDDDDSVTSGQQRENETQRRDGYRWEVSTSTGHTACAVQPIVVVRTPNTLASSLLEPDEMIQICGMVRLESLKSDRTL